MEFYVAKEFQKVFTPLVAIEMKMLKDPGVTQ